VRKTVDGWAELETVRSDVISVCSVRAGTGVFGIDMRRIREVLGKTLLQRVPLAPEYIAGVAPYRGEVLTTLSLRALLVMEESEAASYVVVMEDMEYGDLLGLAVDGMAGVAMVSERTREANPSTLDERSKALFAGAYQIGTGLVAMLDPSQLRHSRLVECGIFDRRTERNER